MPKARKMLSDWKAPYIQSLMKLIETQSKSTLAHWPVDYAELVILPLWNKYYPYDQRPQNALNAAREWLSGAIKLPPAKKVILDCHTAAREVDGNSVAQTAARAIGQCASTIHSARHCIGLAFYGALAVAYDRLGTDVPWGEIEQCAAESADVWKQLYVPLPWRRSQTRQKSIGNADHDLLGTKDILGENYLGVM